MLIRQAEYLENPDDDRYASLLIDYTAEHNDDVRMQKVKNVCFEYLNNKYSLRTVELDELVDLQHFLSERYSQIKDLIRAFKIKSASTPFTNIARILDSIMLNEELDGEAYETNNALLTSELSNLMENIGICYGILERIIEERVHEEI